MLAAQFLAVRNFPPVDGVAVVVQLAAHVASEIGCVMAHRVGSKSEADKRSARDSISLRTWISTPDAPGSLSDNGA